MIKEKTPPCKYCGKTPAYKPACAKKTFVCIDCLFGDEYEADYNRSMQKRGIETIEEFNKRFSKILKKSRK